MGDLNSIDSNEAQLSARTCRISRTVLRLSLPNSSGCSPRRRIDVHASLWPLKNSNLSQDGIVERSPKTE